MSEILVHAFGERVCEMHIAKLIEHPETTYVAVAFVHDGAEGKERVRDSAGVTLQVTEPTRRAAIERMVDCLEDRFGPFNPQQKALDLKRRVVDAPPPKAAVH